MQADFHQEGDRSRGWSSQEWAPLWQETAPGLWKLALSRSPEQLSPVALKAAVPGGKERPLCPAGHWASEQRLPYLLLHPACLTTNSPKAASGSPRPPGCSVVQAHIPQDRRPTATACSGVGTSACSLSLLEVSPVDPCEAQSQGSPYTSMGSPNFTWPVPWHLQIQVAPAPNDLLRPAGQTQRVTSHWTLLERPACVPSTQDGVAGGRWGSPSGLQPCVLSFPIHIFQLGIEQGSLYH